MHVHNPQQPTHCERHGAALIRKRVYWSGNRFGIADPELALFTIGVELPHYLPSRYSEVPDDFHTEAVELLVCDICVSEYPARLALARKHLAKRAVELEKNVTGYFQLSALSEFTHLRKVVPSLRDESSVAIIRRLRADQLRWHVGVIKKWQAERYQHEASKFGFEFFIS